MTQRWSRGRCSRVTGVSDRHCRHLRRYCALAVACCLLPVAKRVRSATARLAHRAVVRNLVDLVDLVHLVDFPLTCMILTPTYFPFVSCHGLMALATAILSRPSLDMLAYLTTFQLPCHRACKLCSHPVLAVTRRLFSHPAMFHAGQCTLYHNSHACGQFPLA